MAASITRDSYLVMVRWVPEVVVLNRSEASPLLTGMVRTASPSTSTSISWSGTCMVATSSRPTSKSRLWFSTP